MTFCTLPRCSKQCATQTCGEVGHLLGFLYVKCVLPTTARIRNVVQHVLFGDRIAAECCYMYTIIVETEESVCVYLMPMTTGQFKMLPAYIGTKHTAL